MPDSSIDQVVTSPPYFRLRDYQVAGQLGLEATIEEWVEKQLAVATQIARVLGPTGTYWLNLTDSFSVHRKEGADRKSLLLGPERLALSLLRDGWILRNKVIWAKTNPMPSSVRDRLTASWEVIYVFAREPSYFFDLDAIRVPHKGTSKAHRSSACTARRRTPRESWRGPNGDDASGLAHLHAKGIVGHPLGRNPSDTWLLPSASSQAGHHATFPPALANRMVRAGCPEARCVRCRLPWRRTLQRLGRTATRGSLHPSCECATGREPGLVLDPFLGSGTTAVAAEQLHRDWVGIELSATFAEQAARRVSDYRRDRAA